MHARGVWAILAMHTFPRHLLVSVSNAPPAARKAAYRRLQKLQGWVVGWVGEGWGVRRVIWVVCGLVWGIGLRRLGCGRAAFGDG
jgi:hypothetical protein